MAEKIEIQCPNCDKAMKVPAELAGKLIRCKVCETPFEVPNPDEPKPAKPATAKPAAAKPATAKPAQAKPAQAKPATAAPATNAPLAFKQDDEPAQKKKVDDDDDDDANPYVVNVDGEDIPRCPFCANELDPPDTKICLTCGYDLLNRKRRTTKKVIALTNNDYFMHWLPAIVCIGVAFTLIGLSIVVTLNMRDWMTGGLLDTDEKSETTLKSQFYVHPLCFNIWIWIFCIFFTFLCLRFAYRRLVINWMPEEVVVKK